MSIKHQSSYETSSHTRPICQTLVLCFLELFNGHSTTNHTHSTGTLFPQKNPAQGVQRLIPPDSKVRTSGKYNGNFVSRLRGKTSCKNVLKEHLKRALLHFYITARSKHFNILFLGFCRIIHHQKTQKVIPYSIK